MNEERAPLTESGQPASAEALPRKPWKPGVLDWGSWILVVLLTILLSAQVLAAHFWLTWVAVVLGTAVIISTPWIWVRKVTASLTNPPARASSL